MKEKLEPARLDPPLWAGDEPGDEALLERFAAVVEGLEAAGLTVRLGSHERSPAEIQEAMNHGLCGRLRQRGDIVPRGYHRVFDGYGLRWTLDRSWLVFLAHVGMVQVETGPQRVSIYDAQGAAFASCDFTESTTDHRYGEWGSDDRDEYGLETLVVFADGHAFDTRTGAIRRVYPLSPGDSESADAMARLWPSNAELNRSEPPEPFVEWLEKWSARLRAA